MTRRSAHRPRARPIPAMSALQCGGSLLLVDAGGPPPIAYQRRGACRHAVVRVFARRAAHRHQLRGARRAPSSSAPRRAAHRRPFHRGAERGIVEPLLQPLGRRARSLRVRAASRCKRHESAATARTVLQMSHDGYVRRFGAGARAEPAALRATASCSKAWTASPARRSWRTSPSPFASICTMPSRCTRPTGAARSTCVLPDRIAWRFEANGPIELEESVHLSDVFGSRATQPARSLERRGGRRQSGEMALHAAFVMRLRSPCRLVLRRPARRPAGSEEDQIRCPLPSDPMPVAGPELLEIRRALISVSDKAGIVDFARALAAHGVEILSTGGTARALQEAGLAVTDVERRHRHAGDDGRPREDAASTHPRRPAGAARRSGASPRRCRSTASRASIALSRTSIPFEATFAAAPDRAETIENIDIGGPAMIRAAAKNAAWVAVAHRPRRLRRRAGGAEGRRRAARPARAACRARLRPHRRL